MKIVFIYNPESGKGRINLEISYIESYIKSKGHELYIKRTFKPNDAFLFSSQSASYDMILVAGGDGTINEVVNGVMTLSKRPLIGYIPTGTVNDVAHLIGIPKNIKKALKIIFEEGLFKEMDITKINDKYFVYASATGKFAKASYDLKRSYKKRYGVLAYFYRGTKEVFQDYKLYGDIKYDKGRFRGPYSLLLFLNGPRVAGIRLRRIKSKLDDGVIEARFFKREPGMLFRFLGFFITGGLYDTRKNKTIKSSKFKVEINKDTEWNIDGEFAFKGSANIEVINRAVKIIINKKKRKLFKY